MVFRIRATTTDTFPPRARRTRRARWREGGSKQAGSKLEAISLPLPAPTTDSELVSFHEFSSFIWGFSPVEFIGSFSPVGFMGRFHLWNLWGCITCRIYGLFSPVEFYEGLPPADFVSYLWKLWDSDLQTYGISHL